MRKGRAAWLGLNTIAFLLGFAFIILSAVSVAMKNWLVLEVGPLTDQPEYVYVSRQRGLWTECTTVTTGDYANSCYSLLPLPLQLAQEFTSNGRYILIERMITPFAQVILIGLASLILLIMIGLLISIMIRPNRWGARSGQYTVISGAALLWFCAFIYFTSLILYFETMTQEAYIVDEALISELSAWPELLRNSTSKTIGDMLYVSFGANIALYLSSVVFLIAAALHEPPVLERCLSKFYALE